MAMFNDPSDPEGPPYGASINYWLGSAPEGDVTIRISDPAATTIRTLERKKEVGINRIW